MHSIIIYFTIVLTGACGPGNISKPSSSTPQLKIPAQPSVPKEFVDLYDRTSIFTETQNATRKNAIDPSTLEEKISLYEFGNKDEVAQIRKDHFKEDVKKYRTNPQFYDWCLTPGWKVEKEKDFVIKSTTKCQNIFEIAAALFPNDETLYTDLLDLGKMNSLVSNWLNTLVSNHSTLINKFKNASLTDQPIYIQKLINSDYFLSPDSNDNFLAKVLEATLPSTNDFKNWVDKQSNDQKRAIYANTQPYIFKRLDMLEEFKISLLLTKYKPVDIEDFLFGKSTINGKETLYPSLFEYPDNGFFIPRFLYAEVLPRLSDEKKAVYEKALTGNLSEHPLLKALQKESPLNAILFLLSIERNKDKVKTIFLTTKDKIYSYQRGYEIIQAFVMTLLDLNEIDFVKEHMADVAGPIIEARRR